MKVLLHICCAPCSIHPLSRLAEDGHQAMGYFHRRNIHPWQECRRREETVVRYARDLGLTVVYEKGYDMEAWLRAAAFREADRCVQCHHDRLYAAASVARKGKFDAYTTTLLYSRFQKHDMIREMGDAVGKSLGVPFLYEDYREGWKQGIEESRRLGMYRQQYCGCIYSEKERYMREIS
ncbi:MAG: epoxyqueuosine reductase QueH [Desulfatibacillaceae bacterium]